MQKHELYMKRCFQLARMGLGKVAPNPLVGSVIVVNNQIIGEGYHQQYGKAHAEVNAIDSVTEQDKHLLSKATLYVNLEPCNHYGKTPPCSHLIVEKKIKKVVICNVDSNPLVGGSGIAYLRENNIEVITDVLTDEGRALNKRFFTFIEKKRPYIIIKFAQTKNGFFAKNSNEQTWITNDLSKQLVHKWRSEEQAILIGTTTALTDNPRLTNRFFEEEQQPVRILIDKDCKISDSAQVFQGLGLPTLVFNELVQRNDTTGAYIKVEFNERVLQEILNECFKRNLQSIIIEGGAYTIQKFLDENLWDEARILTGNTSFENGLLAPIIREKIINEINLDGDRITIIKNTKASS